MSNKINVAICDDNVESLRTQTELITKIMNEKEYQVNIKNFSNPTELLNSEINYDMLFIDVEMDDINGIEVSERIRIKNKECLIFFVTNYNEYIDEILNKNAFRFWVKPLNEQRLSDGIDAAIERIYRNRAYITVNSNQELNKISVKDIIYIYTEDKKTHIVIENEDIVVKESFKSVKESLPKNCFCESYSSIYINFNYVVAYTNTDVICSYNGKEYPLYMSRRKYSEFKKRFIDWTGEQI